MHLQCQFLPIHSHATLRLKDHHVFPASYSASTDSSCPHPQYDTVPVLIGSSLNDKSQEVYSVNLNVGTSLANFGHPSAST